VAGGRQLPDTAITLMRRRRFDGWQNNPNRPSDTRWRNAGATPAVLAVVARLKPQSGNQTATERWFTRLQVRLGDRRLGFCSP